MPELIDRADKKCPRCAEIVKADAQVCRFCGYEFALSEPTAPAVKKERGRAAVGGCLATALIAVGITIFVSKLTEPGSTLASSPWGVDTQMQGIQNKVAADAVKQYDIAKEGGAAMDRCVQAGMVAAAFLQAKDQSSYTSWKAIEASDCKAAGVVMP